MADPSRILVVASPGTSIDDLIARCGGGEVVRVESWPEALARLRAEAFDLVLERPQDEQLWDHARSLLESQRLLRVARDLSAIDPEQLLEMDVQQRIEWLKGSIRRYMHDILHYDNIEIRLLDRNTNLLQPLLSEGMTAFTPGRPLLALPENNGVTGHVAATGKSYLCRDTTQDPLYIEGLPGARSALTVPLVYQNEVIGTLNIESVQPDAFTPHDVQFVEIFSHEIAAALHLLELLSAEKRGTTAAAVDTIAREVALPVDEILVNGTAILDRYIGHDPDLTEKLRKILAAARAIKECIQKVGEDLAPRSTYHRPLETEPPDLRGVRILVVDNDDRVRRSAHGILGRWGCIVETARDGEEAAAMARLAQYDAILADIRLPDMTGYQAYCQFRQTQPHARVILMTGYGYDVHHSLVKARQDGLRFVLFKPFRIDQLREALHGVQPHAPPEMEPTAAQTQDLPTR